ncbi:Rho-binding antiterminator [Cocleimonas flava]|uniref:Rof transcriptional antiterminator n=1 Tax=Cocleimonas flava TaxID=634765 RepID=A0A4R1F1D3_9GAMM|nr:Rho-binding antiterminator [Cocleimonas flava]TCJ85338.1 Rof transcriptional antiterminator [Cocleimonas flava]
MTYNPIQCQLYDYIEIACLRHYKLSIKLLDGSEIQGRAETTRIADKQEFLLISTEVASDINQDITQIRLDKIKSITALDRHAEFSTVEIN